MPFELGVELFDGGHRRVLSLVERVESWRSSVEAGGVRDAGGADAVAVGDGGQALDVAAEDLADRLGLGLAQLRELVGDVGDRAVLLAQLLAGGQSVEQRRTARAAYPSLGEDPGQRLGRLELRVGAR